MYQSPNNRHQWPLSHSSNIQRYIWKKTYSYYFDTDNFFLYLDNCEWDILDNIVNVDKALEHWYQMFLAIVDKHAPH